MFLGSLGSKSKHFSNELDLVLDIALFDSLSLSQPCHLKPLLTS
jgi:hypothetical protein